jgi:hypothetical protein
MSLGAWNVAIKSTRLQLVFSRLSSVNTQGAMVSQALPDYFSLGRQEAGERSLRKRGRWSWKMRDRGWKGRWRRARTSIVLFICFHKVTLNFPIVSGTADLNVYRACWQPTEVRWAWYSLWQNGWWVLSKEAWLPALAHCWSAFYMQRWA